MGGTVVCLPVVDPNCDPLGGLAQNAAQRFLAELAAQASESAAEMLRTLVAGWLTLPGPQVSADSGPVALLRAYTNWATAAIAVGAVLVAAIRLAWERNGREAASLVRGLVMMVVLTGAGVPAVRLLVEIGDSYSDWILDSAAGGDLGARLLALSPAAAGSALSGLTPLVVIGVSLMLIMIAITQVLLLLAQNAGLILLAGALPLVAAAGVSGGGRMVRDRYLTWLLALILYKPAAATVYAAALWTLGKGQDLMTLFAGVVMLAMALVALPALMRLLTPAVSAVSGGSASAGVGAATGAAAAQVATGAVRLSSPTGPAPGGTVTPSSSPVGASPSVPAPTHAAGPPSSGAPAAPAAAPGAATGAAAPSAGATGGTATAGAGAAGAGAAAAGPIGVAVAAATNAGPTAVKKVGGTAAGAVNGEG